MEMNGGAILAMVGKGCVAIASDKRLGQNFLTLSNQFPKLFPMGPEQTESGEKCASNLWIGLSGLATDVQTVSELLKFRTSMYNLREDGRVIRPRAFAQLVSSTLYGKRFGPYYVEPVIAGLEDNGIPFICSTDVIGCINFAKDFVVAGTASNSLYGICESLWEPDMDAERLFECASQCLLNGVDRNAMSGWGALVHIITKDGVISRTLKARQD